MVVKKEKKNKLFHPPGGKERWPVVAIGEIKEFEILFFFEGIIKFDSSFRKKF